MDTEVDLTTVIS